MSVDVSALYLNILEQDPNKQMPIAAIEALSHVIESSKSSTIVGLLEELKEASETLKHSAFNEISLSAGTALLLRFISLALASSSSTSFESYKKDLTREARNFVKSSKLCAQKIVQEASTFISDGACILTHSYSRLVSSTLIHAATVSRKRFSVYVTEARPYGLGVKTQAVLEKAGIPCTVILDSAVAFIMSKCDMCLVGAEAIAWSGGLINAVGTFNLALAAKHYDKPVYALAESFKFLRLFPLSQQDLPSTKSFLNLNEPDPEKDLSHILDRKAPSRLLRTSEYPKPFEMTLEQVEQNPLLDYCSPDLIHAICSDVGILTPSAVADSLLSIFGGVE